MVDVAHDGDDRGTGPLVGVVLLVLVLEVAGQELGLLLLAGVDEADLGADLGAEELDHVVGQRLGRHDHLALQEQEAHDVAGAAVELGPEVTGRRAALDDDLAVRDGCRRGLVRGELRRLELFEVAPASACPSLRWPPPGHAATTSRRRCAGRGATTGSAAEAAATCGTAAVATTGRTTGAAGTACTAGRPATGALRVGTPGRAVLRWACARPCRAGAEWGGRWGRGGPRSRRRGHGLARGAERRAGGARRRVRSVPRCRVAPARRVPAPAAAAGAAGEGEAAGAAGAGADAGAAAAGAGAAAGPGPGPAQPGAAAAGAGGGAGRLLLIRRGRGAGRQVGAGRGVGPRTGSASCRRSGGGRSTRSGSRCRQRTSRSLLDRSAARARAARYRRERAPRRRRPPSSGPAPSAGPADFAALVALAAFFAGAGSSGWTGRRNPSASAFRRTRSACASSMEDEWLLTPIPRERASSSPSLLVRPSSLASS